MECLVSRSSLAAFAVFASLVASAHSAAAQTAVCTGRDLLADLKVSEPQAYDGVRQSAAATENAKALLWKIERADKPDMAPSYLFGTLHLSDDRVQKLSVNVAKALDQSRRVAVEVDDLTTDRIAEALHTLRDKATLPEGQSLDKMLTAQELRLVTARLAKVGLTGEAALRVRPWVVQMLLTISDCERSRQALGRQPLDALIAHRAEARGVGTVGLETVELQLEALAVVPDTHQLRILKASLAMADRLDDLQETLVRRYLERDLGAIWPTHVVLAGKHGATGEAFDAFAESLLVVRNIRMRDRAMLHLHAGGIFVAVGALHLPGKTGLVHILRDEGYTLTAIE